MPSIRRFGLGLLLIVTTAPISGVSAQEAWKSVGAIGSWIDVGSNAASGLGFEADWAAVRPRAAVSGGISLFTAPWARFGLARFRIDRKVSPTAWVNIGVGGGRTTAGDRAFGVRRITVGGMWLRGFNTFELRVHDVGIADNGTTTSEVLVNRRFPRAIEAGVLVGGQWDGEASYMGAQIKARWEALELMSGLVAGSIRIADADLAGGLSEGNLEGYVGFLIPIGTDSPRTLGLVIKRRSGGQAARTIVQLVAKGPIP